MVVGGASAAAFALGATILLAGRRLTRVHTHTMAAAGAVLIGLIVYVERPSFALLYVWLVFFVASFFGPRAVAAHLAWILLCAAVALRVGDPLQSPLSVWLLLAGTLTGAAALVCVVRRSLTALAERERRSRAVLDMVFASAPVGLALFDRELRYVRVNETFASWGGIPPESHVGLRIDDVHAGVGSQVEPSMRRLLATGVPEIGIEASVNGRHYRSSRYPIRDERGEIALIGSIVDDITELTEAKGQLLASLASERETNAFLDGLLEHLPVDLSYVDSELVYRRVNLVALESSGTPASAVLGRTVAEVLPELADSEGEIRRVLKTGEPVVAAERTTEAASVPGESRHWLVHRFPVRGELGAIMGVTSIRTDVSALKVAQARLVELLELEQAECAELEQAQRKLAKLNDRLSRQARTDALTGLANRAAFGEHLAEALERARRAGRALAVLYVDLDDFKLVNDTHGHASGDRVLEAVAGALQAAARDVDLVARLGGDEFLLVLGDLDVAHAATVAATIADRIHDTIRAPIPFGDHVLGVSASVGIGLYPRDGDDDEALIAAADRAMYRSKEATRARAALAHQPETVHPARGAGGLGDGLVAPGPR